MHQEQNNTNMARLASTSRSRPRRENKALRSKCCKEGTSKCYQFLLFKPICSKENRIYTERERRYSILLYCDTSHGIPVYSCDCGSICTECIVLTCLCISWAGIIVYAASLPTIPSEFCLYSV